MFVTSLLSMKRKAGRFIRRGVWNGVIPNLNARSIGFGCTISASGKGSVSSASGLDLSNFCSVVAKFGTLKFGQDVFVGIGAQIICRQAISIGDDCLIAEYVTIRDHDHVFDLSKPTAQAGFVCQPIVIGKNVWLGAKVTILKGVTIGDNSVVGANSVVTKDIPPNSVAAGTPARVIRELETNQ